MKNPQVDAYIGRAAPFARPILRKLRSLFHEACPSIEEKIKWGVPSFECKGMVGGFAAFKNHATFGFWRQDVLPDPLKLFHSKGPMSGKLTDVGQMPPDEVLLAYIRRAVQLNEEGPPPRAAAKSKPPVKTPPDFLAALKKDPRARAAYEGFPPSHKREYVEWIEEAKREETRRKRISTAVEWIAKGRSRNWKYAAK